MPELSTQAVAELDRFEVELRGCASRSRQRRSGRTLGSASAWTRSNWRSPGSERSAAMRRLGRPDAARRGAGARRSAGESYAQPEVYRRLQQDIGRLIQCNHRRASMGRAQSALD